MNSFNFKELAILGRPSPISTVLLLLSFTTAAPVFGQSGEVEVIPLNPSLRSIIPRAGQQVQVSWNKIGPSTPSVSSNATPEPRATGAGYSPAAQQVSSPPQSYQTVDLTGMWQDDFGAKYELRQVGNRLHWAADGRPEYLNVFDGIVTGDTIRGDWVDLPGGRTAAIGELTLCIDSPNRLVKTYSTGYGATILTRLGTPVTTGPGRCTTSAMNQPGAAPTAGAAASSTPSAATPVLPGAAEVGTDGQTLHGTAYRGMGGPGIGSLQCKAECDKDPKCEGWVVIRPGYPSPGCYLMSPVTARLANPCCRSETKSPIPVGAGTPAPATGSSCDLAQAKADGAAGTWRWVSGAAGEVRNFSGAGWNAGDFTSSTGVRGQWRDYSGNPDGSVNLQLSTTAGFTGQEPFIILSPDRLTMHDAAGNIIAQRQCGATASAAQTHPSAPAPSSAGAATGGKPSSDVPGFVSNTTPGTAAPQQKPAPPQTTQPTYSSGSHACNNPNGSDGCTFSTATNLDYFRSPSAPACKASCGQDNRCVAWSWVKPGGFNPRDPPICYRLAAASNIVPAKCCVAGWKTAATTTSGTQVSGGQLGSPPAQGNGAGQYLGCWRDQENRVMSVAIGRAPDMTIDKCVAACRAKGQPFAGLQDSNFCFCGTDYRRAGQATEDSCRMACVGNRAQACGGSWTNSVYATGVKGGTGQTGAASIPPQTPAACWVPFGSAKWPHTNLERAFGRWQMLRPDGTPTGEILTLTGTQPQGSPGGQLRAYTSSLGRSGWWDMYSYGGACSVGGEACGWIRIAMTADYANSPDLVVSKDGGTLTEYATGRLVARKLCP